MEHCDTVLFNGKVVTVDQDFTIAEAAAIGGGKFLKVGTNAEARALAHTNTWEIDLRGRMVVPGFVDTHPHIVHAAMGRATNVPLSALSSIDAIKEAIAERVRKTPPGRWIVASPIGSPPYYFNLPEVLKERRWPTRWDLDEVSPDNPVYIQAPISRVPNTAVLNSYGLRLMGVNRDTPAEQQGVEIVKDSTSGEPNGQLQSMHAIYNFSPFFGRLMSLLPRGTPQDTLVGLRSTIKERNAAGITTAYEGHYLFPEHLLPLKELWSRGELTMRVCFAYELDVTRSLAEIESYMRNLAHATGSGFGDDRLKLCGITISLDGPIAHGLALMNNPYLDPSGRPTTGVQFLPTEKFKQIALLAARNDLRLNSCFGGDRAADVTLEAFEAVDKEIPIRDRRWVIQHVQFPSDEHIAKCKELNLAVTTCTNFEWGKGAEVYVARLGRDMGARAMPLRRWLDAGVPIAQSTDFGPYMPMFTLWQSLKRVHGLTGESLAGPDQKITRKEALRMYTANGARVVFWDDKVGSIEEGKLADLAVLDNDILTCPLNEIRDTNVLMTMLGGVLVSGEL